jgi:hypothetical protein
VVLGALLRLPGLDRESFWVDETIATNAGTRDSIFDAIDFETKVEVNPAPVSQRSLGLARPG